MADKHPATPSVVLTPEQLVGFAHNIAQQKNATIVPGAADKVAVTTSNLSSLRSEKPAVVIKNTTSEEDSGTIVPFRKSGKPNEDG